MTEYPCKNCKRNKSSSCMCGNWQEWFREQWREIRAKFGKEKIEGNPNEKNRAIPR